MCNLRKTLFAVLSTSLILFSPITIGDTDEDKKNASELAGAVHQYMIVTYACQKYFGGLGMYRGAKLEAEAIFMKMGVDRNKAVLLIQKSEDKIKEESPNIEMEKLENQQGISQADIESSCQTTTTNAMDKVKLLQAKLGML